MALQARKKQSKKPTSLPKDFLNSVAKLLNKQFTKEKKDADFLIYGDLYLNELLFCASLANAKSLRAATIYLSMDLTKDISEKPELVTEKLKIMVDIAASWFAQGLEAGDGLDSVLETLKEAGATWESFAWEEQNLFVKVNRDNHALENAANKFLRSAGVDPEELEADEDFMDDVTDPDGEVDPDTLH